MIDRLPPRAPTRRIAWIQVAGLLIAVAAIAAGNGYQAPASSAPTARPSIPPSTAPPEDVTRHEQPAAVGEADGVVPDGTTVFDDAIPGVANLDPALLAALRRAARDAAEGGVEILVNSGWRSAEYQERLLREAVSKYGSARQAARWVGTPETSAHVSGDAVDLGPLAATAWLSRHGAGYGLCQIYRNEPWHFELRPAALDHGCPATYADPTRDPRMQG
jgi:D-alanyl-D-alanine carboxypeptidase